MAGSASRTDPRARRTRERVLRAVAEMVTEEGAGAVTHQRVAERAGVGRATMYRHWPAAVDLLYEAMSEVEAPLFRVADGPLWPWLRGELHRIATELGQPNAIQFTAVLISRAQFDAEAQTLRDRLVARSGAPLAAALERAVTAGELRAVPPIGDLLALLVGPLQFRVVAVGGEADDAFIETVVAAALAPWLAR